MSAPAPALAVPAPGHGGDRAFIHVLGIAQIAAWGSLYYAFPLIGEAMGAALGFAKTEIFGAATIGLCLAGLAAYPVGLAIDAGHGRRVMTGGAVLAAGALTLWATADTLLLFYLAAALAGLAQAAVLYEPAFAVVARRYGPLRARAGITALTFYGGLASTVFIPLTQLLLYAVGWRGALLALAAINLLVCAAGYAWVIDADRDAPRPPPAPSADTRGPLAAVVRRPVFWVLLITFTAYAATFSAFAYHAYPLFLERGLTAIEVVTVLAVIGPCQVLGRLVVWWWLPATPMRTVGRVVVVMLPAALLAFILLPPTLAIAAVVAAVYGAANGIMTIVRGMAVPEMLSTRGYGAINGALTLPSMAAKATAPVLAAWVWQVSGGYDAVLLMVLGSALVVMTGFWAATALSAPPPD